MALIEDLEKQGTFLFRWRSYVPSLILLLSFVYIQDYRYISGSYFYHLVYLTVCFLVSFMGILVRSIAIAFAPGRTSGRNTKQQIADTVNKTGIYSIWRHPLYIGNFLIFLGIVLVCKSISFTLIFILFYWFYYERIIFTEEQFMRRKFGEEYLNWANNTPLFFPAFSHYRKPSLPFSFKNILKREYPTIAGALFAFLFYDYLAVYFNEPLLHSGDLIKAIKPIHIYFFAGTAIFYIATRAIVKLTKLLEVEGR